MKHYLVLLCCFLVFPAYGLTTLSLAQCEQDTLRSSAQLQKLQANVRAAQAQEKASAAALYPSLSLDAKGSWVSEVPTLPMGGTELKFGDTWGYSAGPTVNYVLFDNGGRSAAHKSTGKALSAQEREYEFAKKQTLLQVRQAYFSVQQLLQRLVLLNGQLEVTQKQLADVQAAYQAGVTSKLDVSVAKKQVLQTRTSMSAARGVNETVNFRQRGLLRRSLPLRRGCRPRTEPSPWRGLRN